jgi:hypothetical protein
MLLSPELARSFFKVAGIGGAAFVFALLIFGDLSKLVSSTSLSQEASLAIVMCILIATVALACIGLLIYLVPEKDRAGKNLLLIAPLILVVFGITVAAVLIVVWGIRRSPVVSAQNQPTSQTLPTPPSVPTRPVNGTWDVTMKCPEGSSLNEYAAHFAQGRYARAFANNGLTELSMGYLSNEELEIKGYVAFNQSDVYSVDATARRRGNSFVGSGRFGSSPYCSLDITSRD